MKSALLPIVAGAIFCALGLGAAIGMALCCPTPSSHRPDFERTMFVVLPSCGAIFGALLGLVTMRLSPEAK